MNVNNVVFSIEPHSVILGKQIIEIRDRDNGRLLGTITQGDRMNTIRFLTKHPSYTRTVQAPTILPAVTALEIEFNPE